MLPSIPSGNVASAIGGGYEVANSCRFAEGDSAHLSRTFGSAGNRRTFTVSFWYKTTNKITTGQSVKFGAIFDAGADGSNSDDMYFHTDRLNFSGYYGSTQFILRTTAKYRDPSAWTHFVVAFDTTQGTAANRIKMYANGTQITEFDEETYPAENFQTSYMNLDRLHNIGTLVDGDGFPLDGYLAEFCFIDGSALTPTSFGEFDEDSPTIWKPKDVSGLTFGTNGCYLDFEDSSNLGNDANGGTDYASTNLAATDQATDTPTNNFATWNPLHYTSATLSEGNLKAQSTNGNYISGVSTIGVSTSKWYAEFKLEAESATGESIIGVTGLVRPTSAIDGQTGNFGMRNYNGLIIYTSSGSAYNNSSQHGGFTTNDIMGVGLDMDNGRVYFSKNGGWWNGSSTWGGSTPSSYITLQTDIFEEFFFLSGDAGASVNATWNANFGSPQFTISSGNADANGYGNFEYAVPSGYLALCTKNLGSDGG